MSVIDCRKMNYEKALEDCNKSIFYNNSNTEAILLKSIILRNTDRYNEALENTQNLISYDPLNMGALFELAILSENSAAGKSKKQVIGDLQNLLRDEPDNYLETSARYGNAGFYKDALKLLEIAKNTGKARIINYPMIYYYSGYFYERLNENDSALNNYKKASTLPVDYCSPYGINSATVLRAAIAMIPSDAFAHYYLGNLLCDHKPAESLDLWLKAGGLPSKCSICLCQYQG
jgi:tetratricopeptide (TPR) repeat protein